jgi:hypothetical protein
VLGRDVLGWPDERVSAKQQRVGRFAAWQPLAILQPRLGLFLAAASRE